MAQFTLPAPTPEQRRRYDLLLAGLDLLDQGLAVFDSGPRLVAWNKAFLALLELPETLVRVGTPFEEFIRFNAERGEYGPGDIDKLVAERVASARSFQPHYTERVRPNGGVLAIRGIPIPNLGFVSLWTDITEQRRYEEVIQQQNASLEARVRARTAELEAANLQLAQANHDIDQIADALRRSETRLQLIVDSIPALIAYIDRDEIYRFANKGYAEWFGVNKDDIVGHSIRDVFGEKNYAQIKPHLDRAYAGERVSYEYSREEADRRMAHARSVAVPETDADGAVLGAFVLSIDITEQKASQAALIQAQKMEAVGQLTGGLAHDFNNLLTIIIGNLSTLRAKSEQANPTGELAEYVAPALHAARRGAELIKRLLSFSRQQTLEPCAVEVGALVHNMLHLLMRSLSKTIQMNLRLPSEPLYAFADPYQLENALLNLALNARDAMTDGGELTIAVSHRDFGGSLAELADLAPGEYIQIDVTDTGRGIDPALLPRVLEPFFTTKPFGSGSGLGLSMVYGFLRQSGGNMRILSTPGKGTNVRLVLPMAQPPAAISPPAESDHAPLRQREGPVLLVEDEPEVRKVIRLQLLALGYPVLEAENGIEALNLLENVADIAVLVSDTVMPGGIGGRELAARARALRADLPILFITGYAAGSADDTRATNIPILRKPFDQTALAAALDELAAANNPAPPQEPAPLCP